MYIFKRALLFCFLQQREEKQLETSVESLISRVAHVKSALLNFIFKLENEYERLMWWVNCTQTDFTFTIRNLGARLCGMKKNMVAIISEWEDLWPPRSSNPVEDWWSPGLHPKESTARIQMFLNMVDQVGTQAHGEIHSHGDVCLLLPGRLY